LRHRWTLDPSFPPEERAGLYANPIRITVPNGSLAESCPDPSIIREQGVDDNNWYLYCTSEMFTDRSRLHYMSISKSTDLVNWTYVGDVFAGKPRWAASDAYLWVPDIEYFNGKYYLLGPNALIGLISMGGSGYVNYFNYVHVYALAK
jgi:arabinan endo-1,5-alpha-L-arabinosidase